MIHYRNAGNTSHRASAQGTPGPSPVFGSLGSFPFPTSASTTLPEGFATLRIALSEVPLLLRKENFRLGAISARVDSTFASSLPASCVLGCRFNVTSVLQSRTIYLGQG